MRGVKFLKIIVLSICLVSCEKKPTQQSSKTVPVSAVLIQPHTIPADFEFIGVAKSSHIVELRARVEGYLERILYEEGSLVHQNQLMFVLDRRPFIADLNKAKAELARQQAVLWNAEQVKDRMEPLYKEDAVSQRDLDNAIANELSANADVLSAKASVKSAQLNLDYASIKAPVTGMAGAAKYREGALISPGSSNLLTTIYVIDPIWVDFSVSMGDLLKARQERRLGLLKYPDNMDFDIQIVMPDGSILPAEGKIDFTDPSLEQSTGTMMVRSVLPNPNGWLRPEQFVRVLIKGAYRPNAIIVPQTAVQTGMKGTYVYVVQDGKSEIRPVSTGDWYENFWIITSGLKKGDVVMTEGVNRVQNNTPVMIQTWSDDLPKTQTKSKMSS